MTHNILSALSRANGSGKDSDVANPRKSTRGSFFYVSMIPEAVFVVPGPDRRRSDCTPFTQAGYVGEDADVCIHRLLVAANWDVRRAGTYGWFVNTLTSLADGLLQKLE